MIVGSKAANPLHVDLLGRGRQTGSRHVRDHALTQHSHRGHPPFQLSETSVPAFEGIPSISSPREPLITSYREACSNYGEAVQSNVLYAMPTRPGRAGAGIGQERVF